MEVLQGVDSGGPPGVDSGGTPSVYRCGTPSYSCTWKVLRLQGHKVEVLQGR